MEHPRDDVSDSTVIEIHVDNNSVKPELASWVSRIMQKYYGDTKPRRLLQKSYEPCCTHSYIVSQRGARRLLYHLNQFLPWQVDTSIIKLINLETVISYSVLPPLMTQWIDEDSSLKNSDIDDIKKVYEYDNFRSSVRKEVADAIWGSKKRKYSTFVALR